MIFDQTELQPTKSNRVYAAKAAARFWTKMVLFSPWSYFTRGL